MVNYALYHQICAGGRRGSVRYCAGARGSRCHGAHLLDNAVLTDDIHALAPQLTGLKSVRRGRLASCSTWGPCPADDTGAVREREPGVTATRLSRTAINRLSGRLTATRNRPTAGEAGSATALSSIRRFAHPHFCERERRIRRGQDAIPYQVGQNGAIRIKALDDRYAGEIHRHA
jgi:hypothetical protein